MIKFIIIGGLNYGKRKKKSTQGTNDWWQTCHHPPAIGWIWHSDSWRHPGCIKRSSWRHNQGNDGSWNGWLFRLFKITTFRIRWLSKRLQVKTCQQQLWFHGNRCSTGPSFYFWTTNCKETSERHFRHWPENNLNVRKGNDNTTDFRHNRGYLWIWNIRRIYFWCDW